MTQFGSGFLIGLIIPYQELLGNYDTKTPCCHCLTIIPYQELLGNYDPGRVLVQRAVIIPYQELLGNYDYKIA